MFDKFIDRWYFQHRSIKLQKAQNNNFNKTYYYGGTNIENSFKT